MSVSVSDQHDLELALMRRSVGELAAEQPRCGRCRRTPLVGERVYHYPGGETLCELCRMLKREPHTGSQLIHGPEFGHTMRISDERAAA